MVSGASLRGGALVHEARVLVAVPHPLLREGIRMSLAAGGLSVVGDASDRSSAGALAASRRMDAALVDVDLCDGGICCAREILRAQPAVAVIMLADRYGKTDLLEAVRAGASGFVEKDIDFSSLPQAVRAAVGGEAVIPRHLVAQLVHEVRQPAPDRHSGWSPVELTRREFEVLDLMREGMSTSGIAERLFVSPGTVRSHVMSMMRKLHVGDRDSLVRCAGDPSWQPPVAAL